MRHEFLPFAGKLKDRYDSYLQFADDGKGRDITTGGKTYLATFDQWLDGQPGYDVPEGEAP